jgi:hypothetical protein
MSNAVWMGVSLALFCYLVFQVGSEVSDWILRRLMPEPPPVFLGQQLVHVYLWGIIR